VKIVALYSIKGGVGKTSTAVNLAWAAAERGVRVLLWDLDPQAAATWSLRVRTLERGGVRRLLKHKRPLHAQVLASDHPRIDLLPASLALRKFDHHLAKVRKRRTRLRERAEDLCDRYDLVVLDCPPGLGLLSENVFEAADLLLVPMIPAPLSLRTLDQLVEFLASHRWPALAVAPFLSMVDRRKALHREVAHDLPARVPGLLETFVPISSAVERMGVHRAPVAAFAPHGVAARAYDALYDEVYARLWGTVATVTARGVRDAEGASP
jgi:chromosome partitioning protein